MLSERPEDARRLERTVGTALAAPLSAWDRRVAVLGALPAGEGPFTLGDTVFIACADAVRWHQFWEKVAAAVGAQGLVDLRARAQAFFSSQERRGRNFQVLFDPMLFARVERTEPDSSVASELASELASEEHAAIRTVERPRDPKGGGTTARAPRGRRPGSCDSMTLLSLDLSLRFADGLGLDSHGGRRPSARASRRAAAALSGAPHRPAPPADDPRCGADLCGVEPRRTAARGRVSRLRR